MIEIVERSPQGRMEIRATGLATEQNHEEVLIPAIERVLSGAESVGLPFRINPDFGGKSALGDYLSQVRARYGATARAGIVGGAAWIERARAAMSPFLDVRTGSFRHGGARAWLLA